MEDDRTHSEVGGEKKSVLRKVKDKAKKMKETIKKHGPGHHHHDDDHEEDHQVHGAPMHESTVVRSTTLANESSKNPNTSPARSGNKMEGGSKGQSMKEYLCEKVQPGEEDKALSEAITGGLKNKNERGKVTVSKEVAERLGLDQKNKREGEDAVAAGEESAGEGVAERLQNAVTSWLGKSNGIETAQDSIAHAFVSDAAAGRGPVSNHPHRH